MINLNSKSNLLCCFALFLCLFVAAQNPISIENGIFSINQNNASQITYLIDRNQNNNFSDDTALPYTQPINIENLQLLAGDYGIWVDIIDKNGAKTSQADRIHVLFPTMPDQFFAVVGKETEVYFDNVILAKNISAYSFAVECALPAQINGTKWAFTPRPSDVGAHNFTIQIKDNRGRVLYRKTAKLNIAPSNAGEGREINYLLFGHSYIEGFWWPYSLFNTYLKEPNNPKVRSWGSKIYNQGRSDEFSTEGWAGWKWSDFVNYNTFRFLYKKNPFRDQGFLDLNHYFQKYCGGKALDYIVIHLDINDTYYYNFQNLDDIDKIYKDTVIGNSDIMLREMRKYAPNAHIVICQSPPTARSHDDRPAYGSNSGYRCRQVQHRILQLNQKRFANRENEKIYLMPLQLDLDRNSDFTADETKESGSHPNNTGYAQLGLTSYAWLKNHLANNTSNTPIAPASNNCTNFTAATTITNLLKCNGDKNAAITASASGGTAPYNYTWSNNINKSSIENIGKGTYTVKASDANGCTTTKEVVITEPEAMSLLVKVTDESAPNRKDGTILIAINKGTAPYTFAWSDGTNTPNLSNLEPKVYTITVTDAKGCQQTTTTAVQAFGNESKQSDCLKANLITTVRCDKAEGLIEVKVAQGSGNYTYKWSSGSVGHGFWGKLGVYSVTVTDVDKNCSITLSGELKANQPIAANVTVVGNAVKANPSGGKPPYKVLWTDYNHQTAPPFSTSLQNGSYTCIVQDTEWCESKTTFTVASASNNLLTSANDTESGFSTLIYPNPAKDRCILLSKGWEKAQLYDISGRFIFEKLIQEEKTLIDVSPYQSGIYLLYLFSKEQVKATKVMVSH